MGMMPLAGDFHSGARAEKYSLVIDHCKACDVLQVRDLVPHEVLFNDKYCYASSTVPSLVSHFEELAKYISSVSTNGERVEVLEVGCNDGVLLTALNTLGIHAVGVDASDNMATLARSRGCSVISGTFSSAFAAKTPGLSDRKFDVITCSNMFAHNEDPNDILTGFKLLLKPGGHVIIEVHDAYGLYDKLQWDCFYHEHCFYWSRLALRRILERHGFVMHSISELPMHGCALRAHFQLSDQSGSGVECIDQKVRDIDWNQFGQKARRSALTLRSIVEALHQKGSKIFLYATAGRSVMLVNYSDIASFIECAFDVSPLRANKEVPGTTIRIRPETEAVGMSSNGEIYWLLGAWHLEDALIKKLPHLNRISDKNRVVIPLPHVRIY